MPKTVDPPSCPLIKTEPLPFQPGFTESAPQPASNSPPPPFNSARRPELGPRGNRSASSSSRVSIAHPYARLYAQNEETKSKPRRKIWNHALEKNLFDPYELAALGAPHRRTIYLASLEAHVERLHVELLRLGFWPVSFEQVDSFKGLNSKTAKSMIAGLQYDYSNLELKLMELQRANAGLEKNLKNWEASYSTANQNNPRAT